VIRELDYDDLSICVFKSFNREQSTKVKFVEIDNKLLIREDAFSNNWDLKALELLVCDLRKEKQKGSYIVGKIEDNKLFGYACLRLEMFGSKDQYVQLQGLHVTKDYRGKGLGKELFLLCAEKAMKEGVKKLYISAHPSYETQMFYKELGCKLAEEKNVKLQKLEPNDIQLEYTIKRA
jgi:N-acetylglutamate synthase-like GNAT family acetyltransferase